MTMLQHYYTSCEKGTSGHAGFQIKAMSSGIPSEIQKTINDMIGYRIPPSLDVNAITTHPIALRYDHVGRSTGILVCSQSSGTDENGRPGNFFAHTVVTDTRDFDVFPPIMFWRHPFWKNSDPLERLDIPSEPSFNMSPSLKFEQIWSFLDSGRRKDWFRKLLCAVIQYDVTKRQVIIVDQIDNVAMWIAAVSFALPNVMRPFLSFSTYHHDPYQASYRIVGTTSDSRFHFSPSEYITHFVLNAESNLLSDCEPSLAADFICDNFEPDLYEEKLLAFFSMCNDRLPRTAAGLGQKLEQVVSLFMAVRDRTLKIDDPRAWSSLNSFVSDLDSKKNIAQEDLDDLLRAADLIAESITLIPTTDLITEYGRTLRILSRQTPLSNERCYRDVETLCSFALREQTNYVKQFLEICRDVYSPTVLSQCLGNPEFISSLATKASSANWESHLVIWENIAPLIPFDTYNSAALNRLLESALVALERLPNSDPLLPSAEIEYGLKIMRLATKGHPKLLLDAVIARQKRSTRPLLAWLYYLSVARYPLSERQHYRKQYEALVPDLLMYEFKRDIRTVGDKNLSQQLEIWIDHVRDLPGVQSSLLTSALHYLWSDLTETQKYAIAGDILASDSLSKHLDDAWMTQLLSSHLGKTGIGELQPRATEMYEKWYTHTGLDLRYRALIGGSLAMVKGQFPEGSIPEVRQWLSTLDMGSYKQEAQKLIGRFFNSGSKPDLHGSMLRATYIENHADVFWDLYWEAFGNMLQDKNRVQESIEIFRFWFEQSFSTLIDLPYLIVGFFMQLPDLFWYIQQTNSRTFNKMALLFNQQAAKYPWYPLIARFFASKKRKILGLF